MSIKILNFSLKDVIVAMTNLYALETADKIAYTHMKTNGSIRDSIYVLMSLASIYYHLIETKHNVINIKKKLFYYGIISMIYSIMLNNNRDMWKISKSCIFFFGFLILSCMKSKL